MYLANVSKILSLLCVFSSVICLFISVRFGYKEAKLHSPFSYKFMMQHSLYHPMALFSIIFIFSSIGLLIIRFIILINNFTVYLLIILFNHKNNSHYAPQPPEDLFKKKHVKKEQTKLKKD